MAYISFIKVWESEIDSILSKRDRLQDLNISQLKLEVHDTYKKDGKITTNFKPNNDGDVINEGYLDEKLKKIDGHLSFLETNYNDIILQYNKQSVEDILIQRTDKTTKQILDDKGLFIIFKTLVKFWKIFFSLQGVEEIYQRK